MVQIPQHSHCSMCGKAIKAGEKICSKQCQAEMDQLNNKRRRYAMLFYAATAVFILMVLLNYAGLFMG